MPLHPTPLVSSPLDQKLHVIAVVSNPVRYRSRIALYEQFAKKIVAPEVNLITVEAAFGQRDFTVTKAGNPNHIQLRIHDELWHKENLINVGIQHLSRQHPNWQYVAWIDADIEFVRPDWAAETIQALQHYQIVQPWCSCIDLGPDGQALETHRSFLSVYVEKGLGALQAGNKGYGTFGHPGYAWAARRSAIDGLGGLMDWPILGAADHHMAWAFVGDVRRSHPGGLPPSYLARLMHFEALAAKVVDTNLGYVPGTILHAWHGRKKNRFYQERWAILQRHGFDPDRDILKDSQGLWQLAREKPGLRDDLRAYFRARHEDSIDRGLE